MCIVYIFYAILCIDIKTPASPRPGSVCVAMFSDREISYSRAKRSWASNCGHV